MRGGSWVFGGNVKRRMGAGDGFGRRGQLASPGGGRYTARNHAEETMSVKRITPPEAHKLLDEGYAYLDVRSIPEFEQGHPPGAYNAPIMHVGPGGMAPNGDFLAVVGRAFSKDAKLVVGCKSGGRSQRAAMMLEAAGFTNIVEMMGGFGGEADMMGRVLDPGWARHGLPVEAQAGPGRSWGELKGK